MKFNRRSSAIRHAAALLLLLPFAPSWAVLGGDLASVQTEQTRMRASRVVAAAEQGVSVHDLRLADGSSIRQFVNTQGIVYAVAWSTRLKPDFTQMLGRHQADFDAGVAAKPRGPGVTRSISIDRGDLVVHSAGRLGSFVGKAWLKSQLPAGLGTDAIR